MIMKMYEVCSECPDISIIHNAGYPSVVFGCKRDKDVWITDWPFRTPPHDCPRRGKQEYISEDDWRGAIDPHFCRNR